MSIVEDGRADRPYLPYGRIHLDVELVGEVPGPTQRDHADTGPDPGHV